MAACNSPVEEIYVAPSLSDEIVEVYFFHFSRKCKNCEAIKSETASIIESNFRMQMKEGKLLFRKVNIETEQGREIAAELDIVGQQVLIFKGELRTELTQPAFLFAYENADRYEQILLEEINKLLK